MTYKEKVLKQFSDKFVFNGISLGTAVALSGVDDFICKALDDQMKLFISCIPKEKPMSVFSFVLRGEELEDYMKAKGWNTYRGKLLDNLEDKGLIK